MKKTGFIISFAILLVMQICICNFFRLSQYVILSILPVMILLIPIRKSTIFTLVTAFLTGITVDLLADGLLGLNTLALVPVAYARKGIIRLAFGEEVFARKEDISLHRQGIWKTSVAIFMAQGLFLAIYVWTDSAGTRPFWFCLARFGASLASGYLLSLLIANLLDKEDSR